MKIIDFLLRLYPEEFRSRFGREIGAFHEQRVRERRVPWPRILADHLRAAVGEHLRALRPDIRYALRGIGRRPGFAAVIILTIALGIGASGAIFSVVYGVLLRPLPYPHADRVVTLGHRPPQWLVSEPQFAEYRDRWRSVESLAGFTKGEANLEAGEEPERVAVSAVSREFFATLGVDPAIGRVFAPGEDATRPASVVVMSHALWERRFGSDPGVIGTTVSLNGLPRTVIGVMPRGFEYPSPETALWLPLCSQRSCAPLSTIEADSPDDWGNHYLFVVGRLRENASASRAREEVSAIAGRIMREHPDNFDPSGPLVPEVTPLRDSLVGATRPYLAAMLGSVGFLLLISCANVANLLLARAEGRRGEMALRIAIGASRRRLITQVVTESMVVALLGGAAGLAIAWAGTAALVGIAPASLPRLDHVQVDLSVVAFCFAVSVAAGLLFATLPALGASREVPGDALRSGRGAAAGAGRGRARRALVVGQMAVAMVLLTGAAMLARSLVNLQSVDLGFRPAHVLTAEVSPNYAAYDDDRAVSLHAQLLERVRAVPGVEAAGAARWLPVVDAGGMWDIRVEGKTFPPGRAPTAVPQDVTPGYFEAMGTALVAGRTFTERDRLGAPLVAVVSRQFAESIWPDDDPLGRRFRLGSRDSAWVTVVGVVEDVRARGHADSPEPTMYFPHAQTAASGYFVPRAMTLIVRTAGDPLGVSSAVRGAVRSLDASIPVSSVRTLEQVVGTSTANRRFSTALINGFALLALLLAAVGVYGVISYGVTERTFELGIRMALGAEKRGVVALVMREGGRLALVGVIIGGLSAALLARTIRSLLFGVPFVDPGALLPMSAILVAVALLAAALPARRAATVNPTEALRGGS